MATNVASESRGQSASGEASPNYALGDVGEGLADYLSRGTAQIREFTRGHEGSAVLVALAAGFGLGLVIGGIIGTTQSRPRGWRDRIDVEGFARRVLEQVENLVPEALAERLPNR